MALRKKKRTEHALWRPNFRDAENLPDIKVIRTDFLLNVVSVSLVILVVGLLAYREYRIADLSASVEAVAANIDRNLASDRENVKMSREFAAYEASLAEFIRFHNVPVAPSELLVDLARKQPDPLVLEAVKFSGAWSGRGKDRTAIYSMTLLGTVENAASRPAPQVVSEYRTALAELPTLAAVFGGSELANFTRNDVLAVFDFTIHVNLRNSASTAPSAP